MNESAGSLTLSPPRPAQVAQFSSGSATGVPLTTPAQSAGHVISDGSARAPAISRTNGPTSGHSKRQIEPMLIGFTRKFFVSGGKASGRPILDAVAEFAAPGRRFLGVVGDVAGPGRRILDAVDGCGGPSAPVLERERH